MPTVRPTRPSPPDGILATPRHDKVVRRVLEIDVGDDRIREALELSTYTDSPEEPPTPMRQLLDRLADPTYANHAITTLMREVGVSVPMLLESLRKRDTLLALVNSGKHIGPALDGLGEAATPSWVICPRCGGEGEVVDERASGDAVDEDPVMGTCYAAHGGCDGSGKVKLYGEFNLKAAGVLLGAHGMGAKGGAGGGGGVTIDKLQVQQINTTGGNGDRRDPARAIDVTTTVQRLLEGGGA